MVVMQDHLDPRAQRLLQVADATLEALAPRVRAADPRGLVRPRSQILCAALGVLGQATYRALGGACPRAHAGVGLAGALLGLITKVDDEVIDRPDFHGGPRRRDAAERRAVEGRTRDFLAVTLDSIRAGRPVTDDPRARLGADLGVQLATLGQGEPGRLAHVLGRIEEAWEVQVRAVSILTAHPATVGAGEVARVTAEISGAWLRMIALIGVLPSGAARSMSDAEERAFIEFGGWIQRADALADLEKDAADGLISTVPGHAAYALAGEAYVDAARRGDADWLYGFVRDRGLDVACMSTPGELERLEAALAGLGEVGAWLRWIHGFLTWRYLKHPRCQRSAEHPVMARYVRAADEQSWFGYAAGVAARAA